MIIPSHAKESFYLLLSIIVSVACWLSFAVIILIQPSIIFIALPYASLLFLASFIATGLAHGYLRGNAVRITERQFPEVHTLCTRLIQRLAMKEVPLVYLIEGNGILNAFVSKFLGRHYVVLHSDTFELACEQGDAELAFILAHEFAHIQRKHLSLQLFLLPARIMPFLGKAYSRACELSCDRIAAAVSPRTGVRGLLCLAVGNKLFRHVKIEEYLNQSKEDAGFWSVLSEILSSHPSHPRRIREVFAYMQRESKQAASISAPMRRQHLVGV
jgi:Zn-dependent protease with chaperone function